MNTPHHKHKVDFGIITIREDEFRAVLQRLPEKTEYTGERQKYFIGQVQTRLLDNYRVAVVRCIEQGTGEAQNAAHSFIADLNPQWMLVVGIAGGLPTPDLTLGDVVVSTRIHDLDLEAVLQGRREYALAGGPLSPIAANLVAWLPGNEDLQKNWTVHGSLKNKRPTLPNPIRGLHGDSTWKKKVRASLIENRNRRTPQFTTGPIASSNRLVKDEKIASDWLEFIRPTLAIEMESAGIYRAAQGRQIPFVAIRGISDLVGLRRDSKWGKYACHTAAAFAFALLHSRPIEPIASLHSSRTSVGKEAQRPLNQTQETFLEVQNKEADRLQKAIGVASERKRRLQSIGASTEEVDQHLRSLYREGGSLKEGDLLSEGRYLLIRKIDSGGFATVWEAVDKQQPRHVAIKVLHSSLAHDPLKRERFSRGARIMEDLVHPFIVRVLNSYTSEGSHHYFIMEYISGGNLQNAVLEERIQGTAVIPIILHVGEALAHAHAKGLVHRDVKPENILLDKDNSPRLTDFDLVGGVEMTGGTKTSSVLGTPLFAAPEAMDRPQEAGIRADVYSLGMTALFGIYGKKFKFNDKFILNRIIGKLPCSSAIKHALKKSVAPEAGARHSNITSFCSSLKEAYELPPAPPSPDVVPVAERSASKQTIKSKPQRYGVPKPPRHKILKAMAQFDKEMRNTKTWHNWEQRSTFKHAIEHEGLRYPVKFILSLASGRPSTSFSGGEDANDVIRKQNFTVTSIRHIESPPKSS